MGVELGPVPQQALGTRGGGSPSRSARGTCWGAHAPHPSILLRFSEEGPRGCGLTEGAGLGRLEKGPGRRGVAAGGALRGPAPSARRPPGARGRTAEPG